MQTEEAGRIERLREVMASHGCTCLLVTDLLNIRYLTGFTGSSAALIVSQNDALISSDGRYDEQLRRQCPEIEALIRPMNDTLTEAVVGCLNGRFAGQVHFEHGSMALKQFEELKKSCQGELVGAEPWIEQLRMIKDAGEIALIRKSVELNQTVFQTVMGKLTASTTEREIAAEIEYQGRLLGADGCSFEPIVGVGTNSSLAHYSPGDVKVGEGDFFLLDWGLSYQGYASDLTRMVVTSKIPAKLREIYDVTLAGQMAAIAAMGPGVSAKDIDAAARDVIQAAGFGKEFNHSAGHGIGLFIHEAPRFSASSEDHLAQGMVVTIEPGIYIHGFGGVRIEDDVLITADGCEVLSNLPKELEQCVVPV